MICVDQASHRTSLAVFGRGQDLERSAHKCEGHKLDKGAYWKASPVDWWPKMWQRVVYGLEDP